MMADEQKPMTDEQLAEIRRRITGSSGVYPVGTDAQMVFDRHRLLAEVERLRRALNPNWMEAAEIEHMRVKELEAENAAMRPIVEWMAQAFVSYGPGRPEDTEIYRLIPKALIEQARAFVAQYPQEGKEG